MKYGETLRQRSIAAWSHHNIDYDDIKYFIKERTTPGKGKSISVPGRGDEKHAEFENALFHILEDQHTRIDLFVKSKTGEIQRRLDHAKKQINQLAARTAAFVEQRIPIGRLERYSRLENDVLKAGDEIKSLARFTSTQRTAFRKLLKKYKKWTGSSKLEVRFQEEVLENPKGFTKLDLGPLLDDYSVTLQNIRNIYETRMKQNASRKSVSDAPVAPAAGSSAIEELRASLKTHSKVALDTAIATIALGDQGSLANYFVHHDYIVELQVLLLQHLEYHTPRSRTNSIASSQKESTNKSVPDPADYFMLVADNLDRFAREQSAVTVNEREHLVGATPQRAKFFARWTMDEDATLSIRSDSTKIRSVPLKKKYVDAFFDKNATFPRKSGDDSTNGLHEAAAIRDGMVKDPTIRPLYKISTCRSRFTGLENGSKGVVLATLDTSISMKEAGADIESENNYDFPFAVLQVRKEGSAGTELLSLLDRSHLVERVRGFSLQYHALWQINRPQDIPAPFWLPILSRDIRKLPPPAIRADGSAAASGSGSQSATHRSASITDGTTAVETAATSSSAIPDQLEAPPLRSFRKKRRRTYVEEAPRQVYWSEYDHPEDGEGDDAYVLYIDPNEKSTLDRLFEQIGGFFSRSQEKEESLLPSPTGAEDEETSSDEEASPIQTSTYGTMPRSASARRSSPRSQRRHRSFVPRVTGICLAASMAILVVAYILATTSKQKYATAVDAGILFAIGCSLAFAVVGFIPMLTRRDKDWLSFSIAVTVIIIDAIASGGLLAWILG